mgnify:CR=1 FL=1
MKLFKSLLVAPATLGLLAPLTAHASEVNLNNISTKILAASIRNIDHINESFKAGADIVTIPPKTFEEMYKNSLTDQGLEQFDKDWKELNK